MESLFVYRILPELGGGDAVLFHKNPVKGSRCGKAGLYGYFRNRHFSVFQQTNGLIEPETVDIIRQADFQNIAEAMTDMALTKVQFF